MTWPSLSLPDGPSLDLPPGIGALILTLLPETKSSRALTADVVLAYTTMSGFSVGKWYHRAHRTCHTRGAAPGLIFSTPEGTQWTSAYFRTTLRLGGPTPRRRRLPSSFLWFPRKFYRGKVLVDALLSTRGQHRGDLGPPGPGHRLKKGSDIQTYEHARWRRKRSSETTTAIYRQWTVPDRITLPLFCM
jgi:hypothetical protein